jgi:HD superfamily phosphohydrolase
MLIYDNIHGYINIDPLAESIIDTPMFQRLRNIHQTGLLYMVFPTANHTRFEHSIGTYHLALLMITKLGEKHPDLNITNEIKMIVSIAGLCHDLGHLVYSHLFDNCFLKKLHNYDILKEKTDNIFHENRSKCLLTYLIEKYSIKINANQLKVICDLIDPHNASYDQWKPEYKVGKWIFQIISNPINSIDVDKFDYLIRDTRAVGLKFSFNYCRLINDAKIINDNICYTYQCSEDIYHMFFIRYRLHRQIYNHHVVNAIELLVVKLLFELDKELNISEYILDNEKMLLLVDPFIWFQNKNNSINNIIHDINTRTIPKLVYQEISLNPNNFIEIEKLVKTNFNKETYEIINFNVGYANNNLSNPLSQITFYNKKTNAIVSSNNIHDYSLLINQNHQEYIFRVYCIDLNHYNTFKIFFENIKNK